VTVAVAYDAVSQQVLSDKAYDMCWRLHRHRLIGYSVICITLQKGPLCVFFHNLLKLRAIYMKFLTVVAEEILIQNI